MLDKARFPDHFLWGVATSSYQIEGSPFADGAGENIWHRFSHTPGLVEHGHSGDIACDHYQRAASDVALMHRLGIKAYRFSISWARVLPQGRGRVNEKGLGFYQRLVDELLEHDICPLITLFHWDLPSVLDDRGGWLNRDIAGWFGDYAQTLYRALDDRVKLWITINEPWVMADKGYLQGVHAPGHRNLFEAPIAAHNMLRAHARAVESYRAEGHNEIGIAVNLEPKHPASQNPEDLAAGRRADAYINRYYLDPILLGAYPSELSEIFGEAWPSWFDADLDDIHRPIDFIGINYYTRSVVHNDPDNPPVCVSSVPPPEKSRTEMGWEVYPPGLTNILLWVSDRYGKMPLYVTENGVAFDDPPVVDGRVNDIARAQYLHDHLLAARKAINAGVDLRGYFAWSLLDNFEWNHGYSKRFGLVHVDHNTQLRTPKASARLYSELISSHGTGLGVSDVDGAGIDMNFSQGISDTV
ncbi:MAG: beta-glucosidase [Gammaproteobacteria bacterium]|nr:beta-glucosidase [Gammaproteobacteria bacterium]